MADAGPPPPGRLLWVALTLAGVILSSARLWYEVLLIRPYAVRPFVVYLCVPVLVKSFILRAAVGCALRCTLCMYWGLRALSVYCQGG